MAVDGLKNARVVRSYRADSHHVLLGQGRVVEQDLHHVGMWIAHHALDEISVVRARERFAFPKRERMASAKIWDALLLLDGIAFSSRDQEVGDVV